MSYCRWSSMSFKCDLYCYSHCDGTYTTHVATNKVYTPIFPSPPWVLLTYGKVGQWMWLAMHKLHGWTVHHGKRRDLKAPSAGMTFKDGTADEFLDTLLRLRDEGLRFPDSVIHAAIEESKE